MGTSDRIVIKNLTGSTYHIRLVIKSSEMIVEIFSAAASGTTEVLPMKEMTAKINDQVRSCIKDGKLAFGIQNFSNGPINMNPPLRQGQEGVVFLINPIDN